MIITTTITGGDQGGAAEGGGLYNDYNCHYWNNNNINISINNKNNIMTINIIIIFTCEVQEGAADREDARWGIYNDYYCHYQNN